jgi:glycosyltransferase involved in cell wall biosynthesis
MNIKFLIILNDFDILIYELDNVEEIIKLNSLMNVKVIFYQHTSIFYWIYDNYTIFKSIYKAFYNSKYIVSIIPFDSDYLFNKWGIKTILMNNFITFKFNKVFISDLSSKNILLIGRGNSKEKRFYIGIEAMEYISKEIPNCELSIISSLSRVDKLLKLVNNIGLTNIIKFIGYSSSPEIYFRNASLNFIPSISESFSMVLSETKIYGIPSILLGLDYVSIVEGGTIIIYDDLPESLALESLKIISNKEYMRKLGKEARNSMKQFSNELLIKKWVKLILVVNKGEQYYNKLREEYKKISQTIGMNILNNQLKLLKMRYDAFKGITTNEFENFSYMYNYH